ncbi:uncharacterized protein [Watersipora subatra]|uniref:uncharacterized protein n=1 Tax=Watersipora subatra TaxID=2589382 RepID=UPI00355C4801
MQMESKGTAAICLLTVVTWLMLQSVEGAEIECYLCTSDLDSSCLSNPSTTTSCSLAHGSGCASRLLPGDVIERGCSTIGLYPSGCRVSELAGTECICHEDRCNTVTGMPSMRVPDEETLECYQCDSLQDSSCLHDLDLKNTKNTKVNICPKANGCYLNKRLDDDGLMQYHRLCFNGTAPAMYYPGDCYTVFNKHTSTTSEVCVCYTDQCNKNSFTALQSLSVEEEKPVSGARCLTLRLWSMLSLIFYYFL